MAMHHSFPKASLSGRRRFSGLGRQVLLALIGVVLAFSLPAQGEPPDAPIGEKPLALALFSYHPGYAITDGMLRGMTEALSDLSQVDLRIEYMDAQRFVTAEHLDNLRRLYGAKYGDVPLAAMMVCDDIGLDFVLAHRDELFGAAPLVFCGINDFQPERIAGHGAVTGVNEAPDMTQTLALALELHPQARRVVAISDRTLTGQINRQRFEREQGRFEDQVTIEHWTDLSREAMANRLEALTDRDIVFYLSWLQTPGGRSLSIAESVSFISLRSAAPIYSCWDFVIQHGALGGRVISGEEQGRTAGWMLRRILEGEDADAIPVRMDSPNRFMFDHGQMERFGLRSDQIPRESVILNAPYSYFEAHSHWLWGAVVALLLLATVLFFLGVNVWRRQRAEQSQAETERLLQALMEVIPAPIFHMDASGRYRTVNAMFADLILGLAPDMIVGKGLDDLAAMIPADLRDHYAASDQAVLVDGGLHTIATQAQCADGRRRDFLMGKTRLDDGLGQAAGVVGVMLDLTELHETRRRLAALERRMAQFARTSPNLITIVDRQGIIRFVNYPAEGYTEAQIIGHPVYEYMESPYRLPMRQALDKVITEGCSQTLEWRGIRQGGAPGWYMTVMSPDIDEGAVAGAVLISINITERKKAEQRLRDSESQLRALFDHNPAGLMVVRLRDGAILSVNPMVAPMLGFEPSDLVNRTFLDIIDPEDQALVADQLAERQAGRSDVTCCDIRFQHSRGPSLWTQCATSAYAAGDGPAMLVAVVSIAERKEWETALRDEGRRLRQALEHLPVLLDVLDMDGNILAWNRECEQVTGYGREEIIGNPDALALLYPDAEYRGAMLERFLALGSDFRDEETRITCRNGEQRIISWSNIACQAPIPGWETWAIGVDVTDRRQAEQALRRSESRLRAVIERAPMGIALADPNGVVLEANADFAEMIGYEPHALVGMSFENITHPDDLAREWDMIHQMLDGQAPFYRIEKRYLHRDGSVVWVDVLSASVPGDQGEEGFCFAFIQDITESRRAAEALRASEERYRAVYNAAPLAFIVWDWDMRILDWNERAEAMFGWRRDEIVGRNMGRAIVLPENLPDIEVGIAALREGACARDVVSVNQTRDGRRITCLWNNGLLHDADGQVVGVLSLALDITEQRASQEALAASEREKALLLNALNEVVVYVDRDYRIRWQNRVADDLTRERGDFAVNSRCYAYWHGRDEPCENCSVRQTLADGLLHQHESTQDDGRCWLITSQAVKDGDGNIIGALKTALDITARKQAEQERLEQERRIQHSRSIESLGVLTGGIAHDFNNLLMAILGNADLALRDIPPGSRARRNMEDIELASRRAADLCSQMLAYSGKGRLVVETLDCGAILDEMVPVLQGTMGAKIRLDIHQRQAEAAMIRGDATQVRQVMMNLVLNAVEAMGDGGGVVSIVLDVCHCEGADLANADILEDLPTGPYVCIQVADTGCGMVEETLERLFEPFYTTKFLGRGLGLPAVLGIVRSHGGSLKVLSAPGQGATFEVYLPLFPSTDGAPEGAP